MDRVFLLTIMVFLIVMVVGVERVSPVILAIVDLLVDCYVTSIWGKVVLFICGVLTVVFFLGE